MLLALESKAHAGKGCTFCTLILWLVLLKMRLARIAFAKRRAYETRVSHQWVAMAHRELSSAYLCRYFFLLFAREIDKVVVFCADQERNGCLVETSPLAIPFFDGIECALPGQVEHEEYGDSIVANQGEHINEFALAAEIPD